MILLAACDSNRFQAEEGGEKVLFETVKQGHLGFAYKREDRPEFRVFRTESEWNDFWSESATRSVVAQESVDPIVPGQPFIDPDPLSEQMSMIAPYHIIKFKKYDLPIEFRFIDKR